MRIVACPTARNLLMMSSDVFRTANTSQAFYPYVYPKLSVTEPRLSRENPTLELLAFS